MARLWNKPNIPHRGWRYIEILDFEKNYQICMMCDNEKIRYIHVLEHQSYPTYLHVSCVCAEKLTEDYINPKLKEKEKKQQSARYNSYFKKEWKTTVNNNYTLTFKGDKLLIYKEKSTHYYKFKINNIWFSDKFLEIKYIKEHIYQQLEYMNESNYSLENKNN